MTDKQAEELLRRAYALDSTKPEEKRGLCTVTGPRPMTAP